MSFPQPLLYYPMNTSDSVENKQIQNKADQTPAYDAYLNSSYISKKNYKIGDGSIEFPKKYVTGFGTKTTIESDTSYNLGFAVSKNQLKMLAGIATDNNTQKFIYRTKNVITDNWSNPIEISGGSATNYYYRCGFNGDATRGVVCKAGGYVYFLSWTGATPTSLTKTLDDTYRNYSNVVITADGKRMVAAAGSDIFFSTWNGSNYNAFSTTYNTLTTGKSWIPLCVSETGDRIVYGSDTSGTWYMSFWNGTNYNDGTQFRLEPGVNGSSRVRNACFSTDASILFLVPYNQSNGSILYGFYNQIFDKYDNFTYIPTSLIPGVLDTHAFCFVDGGSEMGYIYANGWNLRTIHCLPVKYSYTRVNPNPVQSYGTIVSITIETSTDKIDAIAVSQDQLKMIMCASSGNSKIYYSTQTSKSSGWSNPTLITAVVNNTIYLDCCLTPDGTRGVACTEYDIYSFDWTGSTPSNFTAVVQVQSTGYSSKRGVTITPDGLLLVSTKGSNIYFSRRSSTSAAFENLTRTSSESQGGVDFRRICISNTGDRIVYGSDSSSYGWRISFWNGTNFDQSTQFNSGSSRGQLWSAVFSADASILFLSYNSNNYGSVEFGYYNADNKTYDNFSYIPVAYIPANENKPGLCFVDDNENIGYLYVCLNTSSNNKYYLPVNKATTASENAAFNNYVSLPIFQPTANGFTIATWFRSNRNQDFARIFNFATGVENKSGSYMLKNHTILSIFEGHLYYTVKNTILNDVGIRTIMNNQINDNSWNHFAVTSSFVGDTASKTSHVILYLNGIPISDTSNIFLYPDKDVMLTTNYLGKSDHAVDPPFYGNIDDFRLYNEILTSDQITKIYNQDSTINSFANYRSWASSFGSAYGGFTVSTSGKYTNYKFTSEGSFTSGANQVVQILCVAGGGGGGGTSAQYFDAGAGGGGGQVHVVVCNLVASQTYKIVVGAGGTGASAVSSPALSSTYIQTATNGGNSTFIGGNISITSDGGGYGGSSYGIDYTSTTGFYKGNSGGSSGGNSGFHFAQHPLMVLSGTTSGAATGSDILEHYTMSGKGTQGIQLNVNPGGDGGSADYEWTTPGNNRDIYGKGGRGGIYQVQHENPPANSGNGGGGGSRNVSNINQPGVNGASGVVILRFIRTTPYLRNGEEIFNKSKEIFNTLGDVGTDNTGYSVEYSDIGTTYNVQNMAPATNSLGESFLYTTIKTLKTGNNWTAANTGLSGISVSMSKNGKRAVAIKRLSADDGNNYIYYSSDYGQNWDPSDAPGSVSWSSVSMSGNTGQFCIAAQTGSIHISSNYGKTWKQVLAVLYRTTTSISETGMHAVVGNSDIAAKTLVSGDYGNTWKETTENNSLISISTSHTGKFGVAITTGSNILYSRDYCVKWEYSSIGLGAANWKKVAMSGSGQYVIASITDVLGYVPGLYYSSDYGKSWSISSNSSSGTWTSISMSGSGRNAIACQSPGNIFFSNNYGVTWTTAQNSPSKNWTAVAISGNGKYAIAAADDIYFSTYDEPNFATVFSVDTFSDYWTPNHNPAISTDGTFAITIHRDTKNLLCSSNKGYSWENLTNAQGLTHVAMSSSGILILIDISNSLKLSTDFGSTFSIVKADGGPWLGLSISDSGQYAIACTSTTGLIYFSNDFCAAWTPFSYFGSSDAGYVPALSRDGSRLIAAAYNRQIAYSTRVGTEWTTGQTWNTTTTTNSWNQWQNVVSSSTGKFAIAVSFNSRIYVSTDYGETWTPKGIYGAIFSACISDSGQYALVAESRISNLNPGYIYYSNNYGDSWNRIVRTLDYWHDIAISGDGNWAFYVGLSSIVFTKLSTATKTDLVYVLEPLLKYKTWSSITEGPVTGVMTNKWLAITMSDNGKYMLTCSSDWLDGRLYYSSNNGVSFTQFVNNFSNEPIANDGRLQWRSVAMSSSGQYAIACYDGLYASGIQSSYNANGYIYYSADYCVNWRKSNAANAGWISVALSAGGKYGLASFSTDIYFSSDFGANWTSLNLKDRNDTYILDSVLYTWPDGRVGIQTASWAGTFMSAALSDSGQYALACFKVGGIYYSNDFCATWNVSNRITDQISTQYTTATSDGAWRNWYHISMSGNGQYAIACDYNSARLYISTNYGVDWTVIKQFYSYFLCSSLSNTGQYACACSTTDMFYSCDFGKTWTIPAGCAGKNWSSVKVSGNGQYAAGCVNGGTIHICLAQNFG